MNIINILFNNKPKQTKPKQPKVEWKCPICGEKEDYTVHDCGLEEVCGDSFFYTCECGNCGKYYTVWYDLVISEVTKY